MIISNAIIGSIFHNGSIGLTNNAFSAFFITGILFTLGIYCLRDFVTSLIGIDSGMGVFLCQSFRAIPVAVLGGIFETPNGNPFVL